MKQKCVNDRLIALNSARHDMERIRNIKKFRRKLARHGPMGNVLNRTLGSRYGPDIHPEAAGIVVGESGRTLDPPAISI